MAKIYRLHEYRIAKRKAYRRQHKHRLDRFMMNFLSRHIQTGFPLIKDCYIARCMGDQQVAWDYSELRDKLSEAIARFLGPKLIAELQCEWWFDSRYLNHEEIFESCLSVYILCY